MDHKQDSLNLLVSSSIMKAAEPFIFLNNIYKLNSHHED